MKLKKRVSAALRDPRLFRAQLRVALARPGRPTASANTGSHVLVCPPGAGNLGDQALVEAFLENTAGPVTLVVRSQSDFSIPSEQMGRVSILELPNLLYGYSPRNSKDVARLAQKISVARSVSICGADIMDGAYNFRASVNRSTIAELAASRGIDSRVLGFSWNGSPHPQAISALSRAAKAGVKLFARDPLSAQRLSADNVAPVVESADMVFSARSIESSVADAWISRFTDQDRPLALVNASGLIREDVDSTAAYAAVVLSLVGTHNVILLPHVRKANSDDLRACEDVLAAVGMTQNVVLLNGALSPRDVRGLCQRADIVITGRMHLAVNALHQRRAPVTLATQGKVEGLMQFFDSPELCVTPSPGMATTILDAVTAAGSISEEQIATNLAEVRRLSAKNFVGLGVE